uniref:Uncharacterized protein n=1 Tax=Romanomermis culicivorax TaxID=13658 RepID=A0A915L599_ROMCU
MIESTANFSTNKAVIIATAILARKTEETLCKHKHFNPENSPSWFICIFRTTIPLCCPPATCKISL